MTNNSYSPGSEAYASIMDSPMNAIPADLPQIPIIYKPLGFTPEGQKILGQTLIYNTGSVTVPVLIALDTESLPYLYQNEREAVLDHEKLHAWDAIGQLSKGAGIKDAKLAYVVDSLSGYKSHEMAEGAAQFWTRVKHGNLPRVMPYTQEEELYRQVLENKGVDTSSITYTTGKIEMKYDMGSNSSAGCSCYST